MESTGADKSHSTSTSNEVSAPLMGKLCAQREDVTGCHRGRIKLQSRKDSELRLIHQVIHLKILMKLFDLLQSSYLFKVSCIDTCAAVFRSVNRC